MDGKIPRFSLSVEKRNKKKKPRAICIIGRAYLSKRRCMGSAVVTVGEEWRSIYGATQWTISQWVRVRISASLLNTLPLPGRFLPVTLYTGNQFRSDGLSPGGGRGCSGARVIYRGINTAAFCGAVYGPVCRFTPGITRHQIMTDSATLD